MEITFKMIDDQIKINWYPGHMKKATDDINKKIKVVDLIIEVVDARGIELTRNSDLDKMLNNKKKLTIALKSDLTDYNFKNEDNIIFGSIYDHKFKRKIIDKLTNIFSDKIENLKRKGLINPQFLIMVIGIPNVGKSSLINFISVKKNLKVENRAGVTKSQETRIINKVFSIIDTPGILFKRIDDYETGYKLALINCIKKEVLPIEKILEYGYNFLINNYYEKIMIFYNLKEKINFDEFLIFFCEKYNFKKINNEYDYTRAYDLFFKHISTSVITKINFN